MMKPAYTIYSTLLEEKNILQCATNMPGQDKRFFFVTPFAADHPSRNLKASKTPSTEQRMQKMYPWLCLDVNVTWKAKDRFAQSPDRPVHFFARLIVAC